MKARTFSLVCVVLIASGVAAGKYSDGTGEPNDPYRIATPEDLNDIGNHVEDYNKCFVMVNDINLAAYAGDQFSMIGDFSHPFTGVFDGNGHAISNFSYNGGASEVGLFRRVGCDWCWSPVIKDLALIEPNVIAQSSYIAGALVGSLTDGTVRGCKVEGGSIWGGSNCSVGGLAGGNSGTIEKCCSTATVGGGVHVGGLVGSSCEFKVMGTVLISDSYSAGSVSGPAIYIGGLVGCNANPIENSYSCGPVAEGPNAGGLVGYGHEFVHYVECFWDSEVNPDVNGIGNTSDPNVIGKRTAEMQTESTFTQAGWDFVEVWGIGENQTYPFLRVCPSGDINHDNRVNFLDLAIVADHWLEGM
ncbi:MAG: hypothetical protein ACYTBJ_12475 [Planctomycetota bacterium]